MIIRSLHLENFRCFEKFDINFDEKLTVLVGVNGAGKTSILDALSISLNKIGHPISVEEDCFFCSPGDISINTNNKDFKYRMMVKSRNQGVTNSANLSLIYNHNYPGTIELLAIDNQGFKELAKNERPLCSSYMAGRFVPDEDAAVQNDSNSPVSTEFIAYENNFNRTIDYASTLFWFNNADADEARAMRDGKHKNETPELKAVRDALSKALLGDYERPRMLGNPPEMVIYKKGTDIAYKVSQLSDGYRAMLALVMDLARRMAQFCDDRNDTSKSILETPSIVLIDEVELHLHPAWQQTVLTTLIDIFPNTQFVVTTHSPQVLTSIPSKHIRILSDGKAHTVNEQTQGAEASRLLKSVFGVETRPYGLSIVQALNKYRDLVYAEKWDSPEAEALRNELNEHFGDDEPLMMELDLHIDNEKWERGL